MSYEQHSPGCTRCAICDDWTDRAAEEREKARTHNLFAAAALAGILAYSGPDGRVVAQAWQAADLMVSYKCAENA